MVSEAHARAMIKDLGNGLVLRSATPADARTLSEFNSLIHGQEGKPEERVGAWTHDLLTRPHPTFRPDDFTIVEQVETGRIVSSLNLISQTWAYAGIEFGVGRPEIVGTHPDFRNRGLVREQFEAIHEWSAARGELMQAITGIPFYYRQFGYEMGLELDGGRAGYEPNVPKLGKDENEPYHLRPAAQEDIPFIQQTYEHARTHSLVSCVRDRRMWEYDLFGKSEKNVNRFEAMIIENGKKEPVGYVFHPWFHWGTGLVATGYELKEGVNWIDVTPSVVRYLWQAGGKLLEKEEKPRTLFGFWLGSQHPVYQVLGERLPRVRDPYAWYVRVPDLAGFVRHLTPVLEERLARSIAVGHTGELKLGFYRSGLKLVFENGRIAAVEDWKPASQNWGHIAFPDLSFLQVLFGYRTPAELEQSYADCWWDGSEYHLLTTILFPRQASYILPVA